MSSNLTLDFRLQPYNPGPSCSCSRSERIRGGCDISIAELLYKITTLALECLSPPKLNLSPEMPAEWRAIRSSFSNTISILAETFKNIPDVFNKRDALISMMTKAKADPTEYDLIYSIYTIFKRVKYHPESPFMTALSLEIDANTSIKEKHRVTLGVEIFEFFAADESEKALFMYKYAYPKRAPLTSAESEQLQADYLALKSAFNLFKEAARAVYESHIKKIVELELQNLALQHEIEMLDVKEIHVFSTNLISTSPAEMVE
jgi:hypothetical protein